MNIYIPVEVKARELESKLLLALEAASRGHEVLLGPLLLVFVWGPIGLVKPGIFHDKSLHGTVNYPSLKKLKMRGNLITSLDEENGLLDESYERFAKVRFSKETLSLASKVFCWGDFDGDSLEKAYPEFSSIIRRTGSPRVDLWKPEFKSFYRNLRANSRHSNLENYILVVSNFGLSLSQNAFWDILHFSKANNFFNNLEEELVMYDKISYELQLLKEYVRMIKQLSADFPDQSIVVRPHPVENIKGWKLLLGDLPNVEVIREGSINRWVNDAKIIIHNGCTTAFEARVNKQNLVAYRPLPSSHEWTVPNEISHEIFDLENLVETVRCCFNSDSFEIEYGESSEKKLRNRLELSDSSYAFQRIVDEWETLTSLELEQKNNWSAFSLRLHFSAFKNKLKNVTRLKKHQGGESTLDVSHKFPTLSLQEVEEYMRCFTLKFPEFKEVKVKKVFDRSFVFSK